MKEVIKKQNAITLIALIITVIILIILAGITMYLTLGENGIIEKAKLSAFATEMQKIKENVVLKQNKNAIDIALGNTVYLFDNLLNTDELEIPDTLKQEFLYVREGYPSDKELKDYDVEDFDNIIANNNNKNNGNAIYIIDKETADGKENTYIYDMQTNIVFKIKKTKIAGKIYHSYEVAKLGKGLEDAPEPDQIVQKESNVAIVSQEYYYSPNMKGFSKNDTVLVYYSEDFSMQIEINVEDYIKAGEPNQITKGTEIYTLHDYKNNIWANVKTTGNNLEAWWVWIPRYAYKINNTSTEPPIDVIYIDLENKPLNPMYNGVLPEGYIPHTAFTTDKELYGIWMSKYDPTNTLNYIPTSSECYAPDMSGFDVNQTYIELYNKDTSNFTEIKLADANLTTVNQNNTWYNYKNNIWANVKTTANGLEAWWVWIPRYAYKITEGVTEVNIIFIDLNNKPMDKETYGEVLPEGYVVHPAFIPSGEDGSKNLKGIWMSKYDPTNTLDHIATSSECYAPDMSGFDTYQTYIELYDKENNTFTEVKLSEANLNTINNTNTWYDYKNNVWANVKTYGNGLEAWWVWIPRYAYKITEGITEVNIIFVDLNNKPIDKQSYGEELPEGYAVHPAFTPSGEDGSKNLKGIWMSKYDPNWTDDVITGTAATGANSLPQYKDQSGTNHTHAANGCGTKERYVTSSTSWCSAYNGTSPCSNYGYYIYCSECGVRLRHYWCKNHVNLDTKVVIDDSNI